MTEVKPRTFIVSLMVMAKKPRFKMFLAIQAQRRVRNETEAVDAVKHLTGMKSRKELVVGSEMGRRYEALITSFNNWNNAR